MSAVRSVCAARQQHAGSSLQPPSLPGGWTDPGRIVAVGSGEDRVVRPFLIFSPLTYNNLLEAYFMLMKEERGSDATPPPPPTALPLPSQGAPH